MPGTHTKCFAQCCPLGQFINQTNRMVNAAQRETIFTFVISTENRNNKNLYICGNSFI